MESVKVHFRLSPDDDGYPPVAVESVWARPHTVSGEYVIDNIPFFTRDATWEDVVSVQPDDDQLWFDKLLRRSGNSLIRVVASDRAGVKGISEALQALGCSTEYASTHNILAVNVPKSIKLEVVQDYLKRQASAEVLDYEEPILRQ